MVELPGMRAKAQEALLDLFATTTGLPLTVYEFQDGSTHPLVSEASLANFEPHCKLIQSFPNGKRMCDADQCTRARRVLQHEREELGACYAGMWNQLVPITVAGDIRGALLYGEMQIDTAEHRRISIEKHERAAQLLSLTEEQASELRQALLKAKKYLPEQLDQYKTLFKSFQEWFYALVVEEERVKLTVQRVTHEIQTRLQAVIADSENLATDSPTLNPVQVKQGALGVLNAALALDTVIQTIGEYLEDYRFGLQSITPILREAKKVYEREALRKGVEIVLDLQQDTPVAAEVSRHHLQHAINNMVHNAVKYSFRTVPTSGKRYVKISCRTHEDIMLISISNYGVGILPDEISSRAIFQMDYQGKLTEGEFRTGSGKGLYFAHRVIDRHGGRIDVESKPATSTVAQEGKPHINRFTIVLPLKQPKGTQ